MIKKTIFKKPIIIITENAWNKIININKKVIVNNGFLFSAKTGGCNGFNYNFNMLKNDEFNEIHKGKLKPNYIEKYNIKVYIDPSSEFYLLGTKIDYVNELIGSSFKISNPLASSSCGCGTSFSI